MTFVSKTNLTSVHTSAHFVANTLLKKVIGCDMKGSARTRNHLPVVIVVNLLAVNIIGSSMKETVEHCFLVEPVTEHSREKRTGISINSSAIQKPTVLAVSRADSASNPLVPVTIYTVTRMQNIAQLRHIPGLLGNRRTEWWTRL